MVLACQHRLLHGSFGVIIPNTLLALEPAVKVHEPGRDHAIIEADLTHQYIHSFVFVLTEGSCKKVKLVTLAPVSIYSIIAIILCVSAA